MGIGFYACLSLGLLFGFIALLFLLLKEKGIYLVSGFNTLSKQEQALYDKNLIVHDMKKQLLGWTFIMLFGALACCCFADYFAFIAYCLWLILFFKEVHLDTRNAFRKYLKKENNE